MADQVSSKLPDGTIKTGAPFWTVTGAGGVPHVALSDGLDTTYVATTQRCMTPDRKIVMSTADWSTTDIPVGSKIKSIRVIAKCGTVSGNNRPRFVINLAQLVLYALFTGNIFKIIPIIFSFLCPKPPPSAPSTTWFFQELEYKTRDANNEEWTLDSINAFTVELGRDDVTGVQGRIGEIRVEAAFNERPVGTATGPSTTQTATTRPTLTHTYADDEGDPQEAVRWLVYASYQYMAVNFDPSLDAKGQPVSKPYHDTGWQVTDQLSYQLEADLVNGDYRAYVYVRQRWDGIGEHVSAPTWIAWTQNVPGPPDPLATATAEDDLWRVRLDAAKGGSSPATETFDFEFSDNAGVDWDYVRGGRQVVAVGGDAATIYDYEAPLNRARWYRVSAYRTLGSIKVMSSYSAPVLATPRSKDFLLKDPKAPALNMALPVSPKGDKPNRKRAQGTFYPVTKDGVDGFPISVTGNDYGEASELSLTLAEDDPEGVRDKLLALWGGRRTLLYQRPTGSQLYIQLLGDITTDDWEIDFGATAEDDPEVEYMILKLAYHQARKPE